MIPADCIKKTKGPALPSMIGISGPLTLIMQLSTPNPAMADRRCSMVAILDPSLYKVVDSVVSPTCSNMAGISTFGSRSDLMKLIPESAGAGSNSKITFLPLCSPTPMALMGLVMVLC